MSTSARSVLWISKRTLVLIGVLVLALAVAAFVVFPRQSADAPITDPAKRIARALATQDLYLKPDDYKGDLTWDAYQQLLAIAPPYQQANARAPLNRVFVRYGSVVLLDQGFFGDSVTALVQVVLRQGGVGGTTTLLEYQLPMTPDGATWKVGPNVTTLVKGAVNSAK